MSKQIVEIDRNWREEVALLQAQLETIKPEIIAAETELAEKLASISAFEFAVRSRLQPLTRRLDALQEEIDALKAVRQRLQLNGLYVDEPYDDILQDVRRYAQASGAASTGDYRYRKAFAEPARPPDLSSEESQELKQQYRLMARRFHPDFALDVEDRAFRTQMMMAVNAAYAAGDLAQLLALAETPDQSAGADYTDEYLAEALAIELRRCQRRLSELQTELTQLQKHPSALLMNRREKLAVSGRDLLEELAEQLGDRISNRMVQLDVLQAEVDALVQGESIFDADGLADAVYDLGLEQVLVEDRERAFAEWQDERRDRFSVDDEEDEGAWDWHRKKK